VSTAKDNHGHGETVIKRGGGKHHDDEHGGAWKVAFADFCLALMALFLVLWLMASREKESIEQSMVAGNGQLEGDGSRPEIGTNPAGSLIERFPGPYRGKGPADGSGGQADAQAEKVSYDSPDELKALSKKLDKMSEEAGLSANLDTLVTPFGLRVMMHDTDKQGMFMRGSALPTGRFATLLKSMGPLFATMENQMLIVGHTDSVKFAGVDRGGISNWSLSSSRSMAARAELLAGGMRPESVLQVAGMADQAPLDVKRTEAGKNRRIELLILTRAKSRELSRMFGAPGASEALTDTVSTSATGDDADLKALRKQLVK
jgi:chemotaxis protein MotB